MATARGRFIADQSGLTRAMTGPQGAATLLATRMARRTSNRAKMLAPVDYGVLRNSIAHDPPKVSGMSVSTKVQATANYALFVHQGVMGGRVIVPVKARALKFQAGGKTVFAQRVVQGSQRARPFLINAARDEGAKLGFTVTGVD